MWNFLKASNYFSFIIRTFWTIVLVSIILFAINNIASVWLRFLYNSTVITIDRDYLNRNVTFPPLTLCLRERLNETAVDEFLVESNKSQKFDEGLRKFLWSLAHFNISNLSDLINIKRNYFNVEDYLNVKWRFFLKKVTLNWILCRLWWKFRINFLTKSHSHHRLMKRFFFMPNQFWLMNWDYATRSIQKFLLI